MIGSGLIAKYCSTILSGDFRSHLVASASATVRFVSCKSGRFYTCIYQSLSMMESYSTLAHPMMKSVQWHRITNSLTPSPLAMNQLIKVRSFYLFFIFNCMDLGWKWSQLWLAAITEVLKQTSVHTAHSKICKRHLLTSICMCKHSVDQKSVWDT